MPAFRPATELETHRVENQPPERGDLDLWAGDLPLREAAAGAAPRREALAAFGAAAGREQLRTAGRLANRHPPELRLFDRGGRRLDEVAFHPAYHELMAFGIGAGYPSIAWTEGTGGHVAHAAMVYMLSQVEPGVCCPMTMTYAAVPALAADPAIAADWTPRMLAARYDPASRPAAEKAGATIGMAMTEKQGGSDVRANTTRAEPDGAAWRLTGHKWFCSAPMSDAFLTLAQAPAGLTCFLVPRWTPDGERNAIRLLRLKDKLGNRANASAEIEYAGAHALALGEPGAGVRTIIEMVHHTRLDTALAPAGLMRAALSEALWWTSGRRAFQRRLIEQPLMASVLADLALEVESALALGLRVAVAFDEGDRAFARIAVALAKFLNNKRCPAAVYEAMECLGGMGYIEDGPLPLLYREAPLNSIWEGSGNVICLDVLRTLDKDTAARERLEAELAAARGRSAAYDRAMDDLARQWRGQPPEAEARWLVERLASLLAASVLLRDGAEPAAEAYVATRVAGEGGRVAGAWPARLDRQGLIARAMPC
ncbi:MAG TPA: acyl-CoA dehydrogenase family protein [Amaricoccus sp.]|uniref:acyl-CoA dehydrogenase family protein n=1 Tax=Amaricoccus sp. TaxID=1872485 RepID=UPI002C537A38|nr:acyl-CoA dehydrogenase family protein [Amaricoccus sp.]HRO10246.1 acyl-CoA dehydrogenase family protein [Amaricoccus sp.]